MVTVGFADRVRKFARRGLRPQSPAAFGFAVGCVIVASLLRVAIDLIAPNADPFATYFPAVLIATLTGGLAAGIVAAVLGASAAYWLFMVPRYDWGPQIVQDMVDVLLFLSAAAAVIWVAAQYRRMVRRLEDEEHHRQVMVEELGHRVKNKLATVYAILRHELREHRDIWDSVAGRLRALSAADDVLLKSDGKGIDLRQILALELEPYGAATVSVHGCEVMVHDRLAVVLSLIVHELVTNAAKYGALSTPNGRLDIGWHEQGDQIALLWCERGGPEVTPPLRRSFGSTLIERSLEAYGGGAKLEFVPAGVICRLSFPNPRVGQGQNAQHTRLVA